MLNNYIQFTLTAHTMNTASIGDIIINTHWERAWALRNQTNVTAQFCHLTRTGTDNVLLAKIHLTVYLYILYRIDQAIESAQ